MDFSPDLDKGQHFMIDQALLKRIVQTSKLNNQDIVLEIGSGKGALTKHLLEVAPKKIICIELDERMTSPDERVDFKQGNAQQLIPTLSFNKVVSNLPYQASEPLLIALLLKKPELITIVVGEHFSQLLQSDSILGLITRSSYNISLQESISPEAFEPKPKVQSTLVLLEKKENPELANLLLPFYTHQRQKVKNYLLTIAEGKKTKKEVKAAWQELPTSLLEEQLYTLSTDAFKRIYTFIKNTFLKH